MARQQRFQVPVWHTRVLLCLLLVVPIVGSWTGGVGASGPLHSSVGSRIAAVYAPLLLVNIGLLGYVARLGSDRWRLHELFGRGWSTLRDAVGDIGLAGLLVLAVMAGEALLPLLLPARESVSAHALVAGTSAERIWWALAAVTIGFGEEVVYRGYLQQQIAANSGQAWLGSAMQALLFGIAHAEQGGLAVGRFALYGLFFGWVAGWRRSLAPVVLCHVLLDLVAGLAG